MSSVPDALAWLAGALVLAALSWAATGRIRERLLRHRVLDHPNARSSHREAKPRGGGLAILPLLLLAWLAALIGPVSAPSGFWVVLPAVMVLALVSWIDDLRPLSPAPRIVVQAAAVSAGIAALVPHGPILHPALPRLLDPFLAGFLWLWFVNLFNFMDGIDGISGVESIAIGLGLTAVAILAGDDGAFGPFAGLLAAAVLGFLIWNWAPSKIFLGDIGSISLGYLLGWLLLLAAMAGHGAAALILPGYYLADASLTLVRRLLRREAFWRAHRQHFYQRAVRLGRGHGAVAGAVAVCDSALIALALLASAGYSWLALVLTAIVLTVFLRYLARLRGGGHG